MNFNAAVEAHVVHEPLVEVRERPVQRCFVCVHGEIPIGGMRPVTANGRSIVVARLSDGSYRAVANTCPREAARMSDGKVERMWHGDEVGEHRQNGRCVIICPWHNFEFDLDTGRSACETDRMRLKTYRVAIEGGNVAVYV
ncbi:MAG: nitrite reductase (NAD(P)H) small subunit [Rubrobacter sp.]|nr:nitrite reductase (NAD(P)H) small subunit [Rubrobacter sp.]